MPKNDQVCKCNVLVVYLYLLDLFIFIFFLLNSKSSNLLAELVCDYILFFNHSTALLINLHRANNCDQWDS